MNVKQQTLGGTARMLRAAAAWSVVLVLAACGGGGDPSAAPPPFGGIAGGGDGGGTAGGPVAADLSLDLSAPSLANNGSNTVTATVTAVDSNRNALADIPVTVSVNNGAVATTSGSKTDAQGKVVAQVGIGADRSNRTITVTAISGGLSRTASFQVVGANLTSTPLPGVIAPGDSGKIDFRLLDANGNAMGGQPIVVAGVGADVSGVTGNSGDFSYTYIAPATGGNLDITATAGGATKVQSVLVQSGSGTIPPATLAVQSSSLAAAPSVVPVNVDGTTNRSELRALFLGAANKPVQNVRVRFDLAGDQNSVGGSLTSGGNVVYSDANGVAATAYQPGSRASPGNGGLTVRACWDTQDFAAGTCPHATTAQLDVVAEAFSVTIGTDPLIEIGPTGLDYVKKYLVQVGDSAGNAKAGIKVSAAVDLLRYFKGQWVPVGDKWAKQQSASCDNEDLNRNGVLEVYGNGAVEDANGSGKLEPRKADVNVSFVPIGANGTDPSVTNGDGQVVLKITYPQNVASWLEFNILVTAGGISGTEGRTTFQGVLPVLAEAITDVNKEPAFRLSPYGLLASPVRFTSNPAGQSGLLCTVKD